MDEFQRPFQLYIYLAFLLDINLNYITQMIWSFCYLN